MAVRAWRSVQVLRPRVSTSGGQSGRGSWSRVEEGEEDVGEFWVWDFVKAAQEAKDVQVRHLEIDRVSFEDYFARNRLGWETNGLPSFPSTTPLGSFFGAGVSDPDGVEV